MPQYELIRVIAAFRDRHLRVYTFLCQLTIAIVTFYCAIAISHYNPAFASSIPKGVALQSPYSDANSTTPHICKTGVRKDFEDLDAIIIVSYSPSSLLSPSTLAYILPCRLGEHTNSCKYRQLHPTACSVPAQPYSSFPSSPSCSAYSRLTPYTRKTSTLLMATCTSSFWVYSPSTSRMF